jgi:hypothetical protein
LPAKTTRPRAGATTGIPERLATSMPEWNWRRPVKGDVRWP